MTSLAFQSSPTLQSSLGLSPAIEAEYQKALEHLPNEHLGPNTLSLHEILRAHFLIANHFAEIGEGLGGIGLRDDGLLESAVYRQVASFQGRMKWGSLFDVCATLFFGLIKDHAFHDANKRTAFLSLLHHLYLNDWCPSAPESQFDDFTVEIANNELSKYARYQKFVKDGESDPEVRFISWYLRKNTRKVDEGHYNVTYNQLQTILNSFGFALENPRGNYIDIVKKKTHGPILGFFGSSREVSTKLGQIGFPKWTAQVGKSAIKTVRKVTELTPKHGVDSASFFQGVDTLPSLISTYHEPLRKLADR